MLKINQKPDGSYIESNSCISFDLHLHISLKALLCNYYKKDSITDKDGKLIDFSQNIDLLADPEQLDKIITSQSNLTQLQSGNVKFVCASLIALEKGFTSTTMRLFAIFSDLNENLLKEIRTEKTSYFQLLQLEILLYNYQKNINFISENNFEINKNKLNVIFNIEGAHSLCSDYNKPETIIDNLKIIKKISHPFRVLYLTPIHLTEFPTCSLAYGMKLSDIIKFDPFNKSEFKPHCSGFTKLGYELIDTAYSDSKTEYPVLIDIRHMSLSSRLDFYNYRKHNNYKLPIIASHVGITGYALHIDIFDYKTYSNSSLKTKCRMSRGLSSSHRLIHLKPSTYKPQNKNYEVSFNPSTINIYDEEIIEIMLSDGMIGISLDQRILGIDTEFHEFMYNQDIELFQIPDKKKSDNSTNTINKNCATLHTQTFLGTLHYILECVEKNKEKFIDILAKKNLTIHEFAKTKICLGSDFDGLIDVIDTIKNASEMPQLREILSEEFDEEFADQFLWKNGFNFTKEHLNRISSETKINKLVV
ncbi:MAG: membrane dipeptidase [Cytophagales bacterium]